MDWKSVLGMELRVQAPVARGKTACTAVAVPEVPEALNCIP